MEFLTNMVLKAVITGCLTYMSAHLAPALRKLCVSFVDSRNEWIRNQQNEYVKAAANLAVAFVEKNYLGAESAKKLTSAIIKAKTYLPKDLQNRVNDSDIEREVELQLKLLKGV